MTKQSFSGLSVEQIIEKHQYQISQPGTTKLATGNNPKSHQ
jgi:hypothetical protein